MKIAQITTSQNGGAGIAAVRLSQALNSVGANSTIVSQRNTANQTSISSKSTTVFQSSVVQSGQDLVTVFSKTEMKSKDLERYDILHFHSTYNLINTKALIDLARSRRIIVTLHDQRMFTGGCHYAGNCTQFEGLCKECPQTRKLFRKFVSREKLRVNALINSSNVHLVSPSSWLARLAQKSIFEGNPIQITRNPIPENDLPAAKVEYKTQRNDEPKFVIGFVAANINNPAKGFIDLMLALHQLPRKLQRRIGLLVVGRGKLLSVGQDVETVHLQNFQHDFGFNPYKAMNLLVVPSRQDNSPNVIGEALMSNVRVLGSMVGGIPELLEPLNCPVINTTNPRVFAERIQEEITSVQQFHYFDRAQGMFGYDVIGSQMLRFYQSCL
jgi:glycosyltransferase involved in cell wall biosynthesis